jgi:hypothetical protein
MQEIEDLLLGFGEQALHTGRSSFIKKATDTKEAAITTAMSRAIDLLQDRIVAVPLAAGLPSVRMVDRRRRIIEFCSILNLGNAGFSF